MSAATKTKTARKSVKRHPAKSVTLPGINARDLKKLALQESGCGAPSKDLMRIIEEASAAEGAAMVAAGLSHDYEPELEGADDLFFGDEDDSL